MADGTLMVHLYSEYNSAESDMSSTNVLSYKNVLLK